MTTTYLNDLIGTHNGESCWIYGLGPSNKQPPIYPCTMIGVNDVENHGIDVDYLVCIDQLKSFDNEPERKSCINKTKAKYVFTQCNEHQLPLTGSNRVEISISDRRGEVLLNPKILDVSYTSVFVAMQIAYHLGFNEIFIAGCDIGLDSNHHLAVKTNEIRNHFTLLKDEMISKRPEMKIWNHSNVNGVLSNFSKISSWYKT